MVNKKLGRIIRKPELLYKVGKSDTAVWRLEKAGKFPLRIAIGPNSVGWFEDEIDEWLRALTVSIVRL